jgi:hypothetical protein
VREQTGCVLCTVRTLGLARCRLFPVMERKVLGGRSIVRSTIEFYFLIIT